MDIFNGLDVYIVILLTVVAYVAGFVDSVAGGGGLLMTPSLLLAGIPPQFALGTNKFMAIFGTSAAVINFARNGKIIWRIAIIGLIFSCIGSVLGTKLILFFDPQTVVKIILTLLPFTAIVVFIPKRKLKTEVVDFNKTELYIATPIISMILGFYDGFFGPGTGTFLIIAFYSILGMNLVNASAVAKVINLSSGIGSFITFAISNKIIYTLGLPLIVANILGGYTGSKMVMSVGQKFVRYMIIIVFVVMFISLVVKYF